MGMKKYEALISKIFYFLFSTTSLAMLGALCFISSTISSPRIHATLVAAAYELVMTARSTKMLVFILFHIIIVVICYRRSSKPASDSELDSNGFPVVTPKVQVEACAYGDECGKGGGLDGTGLKNTVDGFDDTRDVLYEGDVEYDDEYENDNDEDVEMHGDLSGRIEEFIGSVMRTWKEELLKEKKILRLVEDTESMYMLVPYEMV